MNCLNIQMQHLTIFVILGLLLSVSSEDKKPPFWKKAENARWLAHKNVWGTLSTTSIHLKGQAWGQPKSFADGSYSNSTGNLYFYDSDMDTSMVDIKKNNKVSFAITEAERGFCTIDRIDPEDPRCARVVFSGEFVEVDDVEEQVDAQSFLFNRHPAMSSWPDDHSWKVHKIVISEIWLINIYGGASIVDVDEYFNVNLN
jgi:hypothetical protein